MLRLPHLIVLGLLASIGCGGAKPTPPTDPAPIVDLGQGDEADENETDMKYQHQLKGPTNYYDSAPRDPMAPPQFAAGQLPGGIHFMVLRTVGGYAEIETEHGVRTYVNVDESIANASPNEAVQAIADSETQFAIDLYHKLRAADGNVFYSPASIYIALAMTSGGAAGDTTTEFANVLHLDPNDTKAHDAIELIQSNWRTPASEADVSIRTANRLWGANDLEVAPAFTNLMQDSYGAGLERLDFSMSEQARGAINGWVSEQTKAKIPELIPDGLLTADTRLVLTNAVYFNGKWADEFDEKLTVEADFHSPTGTLKAQMMSQTGNYGYAERADAQVLSIPYGNRHFSMCLVLPKSRDGLSALESKLDAKTIDDWLNSARRLREVRVSIPKFKVTSEFELKDPLIELGLVRAFDLAEADFSGMSTAERLAISAVVHKAYVDVHEKGSEAAAASAVMMVRGAKPSDPPVFRADHPFWFAIRDNRTGALLFVGRVVDPTS